MSYRAKSSIFVQHHMNEEEVLAEEDPCEIFHRPWEQTEMQSVSG